MECPNCETEMIVDDYADEFGAFGDTSRCYKSWTYVCPNCNKKYIEIIEYAMIIRTVEEIESEE